jgi:hypothetical protein
MLCALCSCQEQLLHACLVGAAHWRLCWWLPCMADMCALASTLMRRTIHIMDKAVRAQRSVPVLYVQPTMKARFAGQTVL